MICEFCKQEMDAGPTYLIWTSTNTTDPPPNNARRVRVWKCNNDRCFGPEVTEEIAP